MNAHENALLLVAAVALQAWRDAQAGSEEARDWLDVVAPDWGEWRPPASLAIGARARKVDKHKEGIRRKAQTLAQRGRNENGVTSGQAKIVRQQRAPRSTSATIRPRGQTIQPTDAR